ncbi:hypothetical protein [Clostridium sp.]|uniref:hypothetical protein n=1 Tax=Clostridium sp. TaxID=1506 RepID=UPI003217BC90
MGRSKVITIKGGELNVAIYKTGILNRNRRIDYGNTMVDSKTLLKNSRIKVIIEGEEIFIYSIVTPRVESKKLYLIIRNDLINKFHDIENLIFDYRIYSKKKNSLQVTVYCINIENLPLLDEELLKNSIIKSIKVIQGEYVNCYSEKLKKYVSKVRSCATKLNHKEFILVANKDEYIYIMKVEQGILVSNRVTLYHDYKVHEEMKNFLQEANQGEQNTERIYIFVREGYEDIKIARVSEIERYLLGSRFLADDVMECK